MQKYRKTSHTIYDIKYHLVWTTKCRENMLKGELAKCVRELIRDVCKSNKVEIIKGHVLKNPVLLFISVLPHISVSKWMQDIKGKSSKKIMSEYKTVSKMY